MGQILVRQLKDETIAALKRRAKANNRSTEAEVREIIERSISIGMDSPFATKRSLRELAGSVPGNRTTEEIVADVRALRDEWDDR